jgi:translation initiation factor eIF-2B subunit gamma
MAGAGHASAFQAVVLCGGEGSGLFPLTPQACKALLPVANVPLLAYQLASLEAAGFDEALVVCHARHADELTKFASAQPRGGLRVLVHVLGEHSSGEEGTLMALRTLRDRVRGDVFVLAGDVITSAPLAALADLHRSRDAAVTMLLKQHKGASSAEGRKVLRALSKHVVNYFGLVRVPGGAEDAQQVVMMKSTTGDEALELSKTVLARHPEVRLHADLVDGHVYVLRKWVFDLVCDGADKGPVASAVRAMPTLRTVFLPFFVNKVQAICEQVALGRAVDAALRVPYAAQAQARRGGLLSEYDKAGARQNAALCLALVLPAEAYLMRCNTMFAYAMANHDLVAMAAAPAQPAQEPAPWPKPQLHPGCKGTTVGRGCQLGERVMLTNCIVGAHCFIGAGAMLSNSVLMDHCSVGKGSVVQNCVLGPNVQVEDNCNLDSVQAQAGYSVAAGQRIKGQALSDDKSRGFAA